MKNRKIVFGTAGIFFGLLVLFFLLNYFDVRLLFVSKENDKKITAWIGSLPLLPKSNRQTLLAAFWKNTGLKSYHVSINFSLNNQNGQELGNLTLKGAFEQSPETRNYQVNLAGNLAPATKDSFQIDSLEKDKTFYWKLQNLPTFLGIDFTKLNNTWYQSDISSFEKELKVKAKNDTDIQKDIQNFLEPKPEDEIKVFREAKRVENQENIDFSFILHEQDFPNLKWLDGQEITLAVGKKSGYFSGFKIGLSGEQARQVLPLSSSVAKMQIEATFSDFNKPVDFIAPEKTKSIDSSFALYDSLKGKDSSPNLFFDVKKAADLGSSFLTVERLTHVFLLFPRSF